MYILGISEIDNDAGAVLLNGPEVVCGINEERLSRVKRHQGFPYRSVRWIQEFSGVTLEEIDHIAIAKAHPLQNPERFYRPRQLLDEHAYFSSEDPSGFPFKLLKSTASRPAFLPKVLPGKADNQRDRNGAGSATQGVFPARGAAWTG